MKRRVLVISGFILGLCAAGGLGFFAYKHFAANASSITTDGATIVCNDSMLASGVINTETGKDFIMDHVMSLGSIGIFDTYSNGIFIRSGNNIYYTDGNTYSTKPANKTGFVTLQLGDVYYQADSASATDISSSKISAPGTAALYAYYDNGAWGLDLTSMELFITTTAKPNSVGQTEGQLMKLMSRKKLS